MNLELISNYEKLSPYGKFHCDNIGYQWIEKTTGKIIDKGIMFSLFLDYPKRRLILTNGFDEDFERIEKFDYKDGVWDGIPFSLVGGKYGVRIPY